MEQISRIIWYAHVRSSDRSQRQRRLTDKQSLSLAVRKSLSLIFSTTFLIAYHVFEADFVLQTIKTSRRDLETKDLEALAWVRAT